MAREVSGRGSPYHSLTVGVYFSIDELNPTLELNVPILEK